MNVACIVAVVILPAVYLFLINRADLMPEWFKHFDLTIKGSVPPFLQFIIVDVVFFLTSLCLSRVGGGRLVLWEIISALIICRFVMHSGWAVSEIIVLVTLFNLIEKTFSLRLAPIRAAVIVLTQTIILMRNS